MSSRVRLTSWGESNSLVLVGNTSSDGEVPDGLDNLFHQPVLHTIFCNGLVQIESESLDQLRLT